MAAAVKALDLDPPSAPVVGIASIGFFYVLTLFLGLGSAMSRTE